MGYEMDPEDTAVSPMNLWDRNRREAEMKTIFRDDGNRWASVSRSDFDGLGHYRTTTTGGNFGEGDIKATTRDWNPSRGTFGASGYSMFPENADWLLGTYGEERVTEGGQTFVRQTCFDEAKGLLLRERIQEASSRRSGDIDPSVHVRRAPASAPAPSSSAATARRCPPPRTCAPWACRRPSTASTTPTSTACSPPPPGPNPTAPPSPGRPWT